MNVLVFPGMHGSDELLQDFQSVAPNHLSVRLLSLPSDAHAYEKLVHHFEPTVVEAGDCTLVGESFSGPLTVLLAERCPNVRRLVMVATFVTPPTPWFAWMLPWELLCRMPPSNTFIRKFMLGQDAKLELVNSTRRAVRSLPAKTMARRMREVSKVDVRIPLSKLLCDILYIRPEFDWLVPKRCVTQVQLHSPSVEVISLPSHHLVLQRFANDSWASITSSRGSCGQDDTSDT